MAPTHLTELRLESIAAHVVHGCSHTTTYFALEEDGRLLVKLDWHARATHVIRDLPNAQGVLAARGKEFVVWTECNAFHTTFCLDGGQFTKSTLLVYVPNHDTAVLATSCKEQLLRGSVAPLNDANAVSQVIEDVSGARRIGSPKANFVISAATGQNFTVGVPLDLFDLKGVASLPNLHWALWLLNVPEVDVFTLSGDCDKPIILPINLDTLQLGV